MRQIEPGDPTPFWRQLKSILRDLALAELQPGERIPSEPALCRQFGLSRATVRQAITALVDDGLLARQQGRGTFVLPPKALEPLGGAQDFLRTSFDQPESGQVRLFSAETVAADRRLSDKLGLTEGEQIYKVRKLLLQPESPAAYKVAYLPQRLCPGLLHYDLAARSIYRVLEDEYGLRLQEAEETVECIVADEFRSHVLEVPESYPLIAVERLVREEGSRAVEFSRAYYRADRFKLWRRIGRDSASQQEAVLREVARAGR